LHAQGEGRRLWSWWQKGWARVTWHSPIIELLLLLALSRRIEQ